MNCHKTSETKPVTGSTCACHQLEPTGTISTSHFPIHVNICREHSRRYGSCTIRPDRPKRCSSPSCAAGLGLGVRTLSQQSLGTSSVAVSSLLWALPEFSAPLVAATAGGPAADFCERARAATARGILRRRAGDGGG